MRGRHSDAFSMYKQTALRVYVDSYKDENADRFANGAVKYINPSWRRSFPHILVAALSSFLFGYQLGIVNETLERISLDLGFNGNVMAEGLVVSTCLGGAFVGSLLSGWVADGVGRRRAFQLCALPMIIGATMSGTTNNLWGMLRGRLFVGTGMGLGPAVAALYVAEVSPTSVRGTFGSLTKLATCLGILASLLVGIPAKDIVNWWRVYFWISVFPAAALAILMEFCAESPHWLFKRARAAEAENQFEKILGGMHVKSAMAELSKGDRGDEPDAVKLTELFYGRYFRRSIFAMILMDKLGRRVLLLESFMGMAFSMSIQAIAGSSLVAGPSAVYMSVGSMLMVVLTFALGAGPVPGLLLSEIFPSRIRAKAMAICMAVHWVINFFVGLLFLHLLEKIGPVLLYAIFAAFCVIATSFVKRYVAETKGKSLQEIEIALLPQE